MLKPINICNEIKYGYINYLLSAYPLVIQEIEKEFIHLISSSKDSFFNGPFLSISKPFLKGKSLQYLIESGLLHKEFEKKQFYPERSLYSHQEQAIRKLTENRNLVIATGTGSGKTESFLLPIINNLLEEQTKGNLKEEVYALILYPMNALVNDQLIRLRKYLKDFPEITFGRYIGETKHTESEALSSFKKQWKTTPLPNELISREKMQKQTPNILITNYSMLEYMLLRPTDAKFFNGNSWKFLVLDEAHVYDGVVGQECSLLLRRLKDRVLRKTTNFRCIATSATLGDGKKDFEKVAEFATKLFGEPFTSEDIITADYEEIKLPDENSTLKRTKDEYLSIWNESEKINSITDKNKYLYDCLEKDYFVNKIKQLFQLEPVLSLKDICKHTKLDDKTIELLISLSSQGIKDDIKLMPAKFHFFIRAMEGLFVQFKTPYNIAIKPAVKDDTGYRYFELGLCRDCHSLFILGRNKEHNGKNYLFPTRNALENEELSSEVKPDEYYAIFDMSFYGGNPQIKELIEERIEEGNMPTHTLCGKCGEIITFGNELSCKCKDNLILTLKYNEKKTKCIICNSYTTKIRQISNFSTGKYAPTYVVAKFFYDNLPEIIKKNTEQEVDVFDVKRSVPSGNRKLLCFSDNRQDAAIFAANVEDKFDSFYFRHLLFIIFCNQLKKQSCSIPILINSYKQYYQKINGQKNISEINLHVIKEIINHSKRDALEKNYLIGFDYEINESLINSELCDFLGFDKTTIMDFLKIILDTVRLDACINFDQHNDLRVNYALLRPEFGVNSVPWCYVTNEADEDTAAKKWFTVRGLNLRKDIIFNKLYSSKSDEDKIKIINGIFKLLKQLNIISQNGQIPIEKISIIEPQNWYKCQKCNAITYRNIQDICMEKLCNGKLVKVEDIDSENTNNQYYVLPKQALKNNPPELIAEEHTAQLSSSRAALFQHDFEEGNINLLSCSTTFEMGVDLGDLNAVFLRNIPPTPANYIQRSGRAGRNDDNSALIVSYCQRRAHDLNYFESPTKMINGKVRVPSIDVSNHRINLRHLYAVAISYFFNNEIKSFFIGKANIKNFIENEYHNRFHELIKNKPEEIFKSIIYVFKDTKSKELETCINNWEWVDLLYNDSFGNYSISKAIDLYLDNISYYKEKLHSAQKNREQSDWIIRILNTFEDEKIINFFVDNGILPHYGFPTDVVKVYLDNKAFNRNDEPVDLTRDLRTALSEYAPGNEVIACKYKFEINGIKKLRDKEFPLISYAICKKCNRLYSSITDKIPASCCSASLEISHYITPEFGFINQTVPNRALGSMPKRLSFAKENYAGPYEMPFKDFIYNFKEFHEDQGSIIFINSRQNLGFSFDQQGLFHKDRRLNNVHLGYNFKTDIFALIPPYKLLEVKSFMDKYWPIDSFDGNPWFAFWYTVLYSLIYSACNLLAIDERGVSGIVTIISNEPVLIIYDTLPGGSGFANRIRENFQEIINYTLVYLNKCTCQESCYSCLRGYANERHHYKLNRKAVIGYFTNLLEYKYKNNYTNN